MVENPSGRHPSSMVFSFPNSLSSLSIPIGFIALLIVLSCFCGTLVFSKFFIINGYLGLPIQLMFLLGKVFPRCSCCFWYLMPHTCMFAQLVGSLSTCDELMSRS